MLRLPDLARHFPALETIEIRHWVARRWVLPDADDAGEWVFTETDVARIRLIADLRHDLAVADETMPLVLSLLDQLDHVRRQVRALADVIEALPDDVRRGLPGLTR